MKMFQIGGCLMLGWIWGMAEPKNIPLALGGYLFSAMIFIALTLFLTTLMEKSK